MTEEKKKGFWRHAFAVEKSEAFEATEPEQAVLDAVAQKAIRHGLAIPAILALESSRPLNFIGAQAMAFFEPIVRTIFAEWEGYTIFYKVMERRGSVEYLIGRVEFFENERQAELAKARAERKGKKHKPKSENVEPGQK